MEQMWSKFLKVIPALEKETSKTSPIHLLELFLTMHLYSSKSTRD